MLQETGCRFQEQTVLDETLRVAKHWGFDLQDIRCPLRSGRARKTLGSVGNLSRLGVVDIYLPTVGMFLPLQGMAKHLARNNLDC